MSDSSPRETILKKIREALIESTPFPFPENEGADTRFTSPQEDLDVLFAEEFRRLQGKFAFCLNSNELCLQLAALVKEKNWTSIFCQDAGVQRLLAAGSFERYYSSSLADCDASITTCESLVARTGSIVLSSIGAGGGGRTTSIYAPVHICVASIKQLVFDIKDALVQVKEKYQQQMPSLISFASGPSRTADIEKTLVTGVHGPKEVYLFLLEEALVL